MHISIHIRNAGLWDKGDLALFLLWHWRRYICSEFELVPSGLNALYPLLFLLSSSGFLWNVEILFLCFLAIMPWSFLWMYIKAPVPNTFLFSSMIFLNNLLFIFVVFFCCRLQHVIKFVLTQQVYDFQTCNYCRYFRSFCLFQHAILSSIKYYRLWY